MRRDEIMGAIIQRKAGMINSAVYSLPTFLGWLSETRHDMKIAVQKTYRR